MNENTYQADVVIVGGGIAGIVTALELLDHNCKVIILDRDRPENFGGLAKESFGGIFIVNSPQQRLMGIKDSPELALRDWLSYGELDCDGGLPRQWAEEYVNRCRADVYHWLSKRSVRFFPVVHWAERGLFQPGNSVPRFHMVWGTGHGLIEALVHHLRQHRNSANAQLHFGHRVTDIEVSGGVVTGVRGINENTGEPFTASGEAVVVATGGICGSIERIKNNWYEPWGKPPEIILNGSHHFATGELHDAVARLDGNLTHLEKQWHYAAGIPHPSPKRPNHGLSIVPPRSALWVDCHGQRVGPVPLVYGYDTRYMVEQVCKLDEQYSWQIMNWKIAVKELAVSGAEFNDEIREKRPIGFLRAILIGNPQLVRHLMENSADVVVADSLDELVERMNALNGADVVERQALIETVARYDDNIRRGKKFHNDEQIRRIAHLRQYRGDRVRVCKFQPIDDPGARPLIAIREFIVARKSLGGIQTDLKCRVLKPDQTTIPGLYAVGEAAGFGGGGVHGLRALEGTFLGTCILTGRVAGQAIATG